MVLLITKFEITIPFIDISNAWTGNPINAEPANLDLTKILLGKWHWIMPCVYIETISSMFAIQIYQKIDLGLLGT